MKFARTVFVAAGVYGMITLVPMYFLEAEIASGDLPTLTHPEYFYGFLGVAVAWQVLFIVIGVDPPRYRPVMLVAFIEKLGFGVAAVALYLAHRIQVPILVFGLIDLVLGGLFLAAFVVLPNRRAAVKFSRSSHARSEG